MYIQGNTDAKQEANLSFLCTDKVLTGCFVDGAGRPEEWCMMGRHGCQHQLLLEKSSSLLLKLLSLDIEKEYEFPYGKFLFLRDNDLPPFSFKLLFSG